MARPYRTRSSKRIIMRSGNGRFRKTTIQDLGVSKSSLQDGPAVCIDCGHGAAEWWHPVMKEGFCPRCKSTKKISVNLLPMPQWAEGQDARETRVLLGHKEDGCSA